MCIWLGEFVLPFMKEKLFLLSSIRALLVNYKSYTHSKSGYLTVLFTKHMHSTGVNSVYGCPGCIHIFMNFNINLINIKTLKQCLLNSFGESILTSFLLTEIEPVMVFCCTGSGHYQTSCAFCNAFMLTMVVNEWLFKLP